VRIDRTYGHIGHTDARLKRDTRRSAHTPLDRSIGRSVGHITHTYHTHLSIDRSVGHITHISHTYHTYRSVGHITHTSHTHHTHITPIESIDRSIGHITHTYHTHISHTHITYHTHLSIDRSVGHITHTYHTHISHITHTYRSIGRSDTSHTHITHTHHTYVSHTSHIRIDRHTCTRASRSSRANRSIVPRSRVARMTSTFAQRWLRPEVRDRPRPRPRPRLDRASIVARGRWGGWDTLATRRDAMRCDALTDGLTVCVCVCVCV
jgi:hypothetical protein